MSITEDISVKQDAQAQNLRIPPHVVTLVRWCMSCIWRAASVVLQRLVTPPLPNIPALMRSETTFSQNGTRVKCLASRTVVRRPPSSEHISEEPKVECVVLHEPHCQPTLDIIFVHGLYGSLANTWRQGDWQNKYKIGPNIIPLRKHATVQCVCDVRNNKDADQKSNLENINRSVSNCGKSSSIEETNNCDNVNDNYELNKEVFFEKIVPKDKIFDEGFAKTFLNQVQIVENYSAEEFIENFLIQNMNRGNNLNCLVDENHNTKKDLKDREEENEKSLENCCECDTRGEECVCEGCGCICNKCYSDCWPRDWLRVDHPTCRVISINYTSDPYLWRPIWIKECKRLQLSERAEQMTKQLLQLGVGDRPVVWVGHSKGGLFIKQIYSEAYDAHVRLAENIDVNDNHRVKDFELECDLELDLQRRSRLWDQSVGFMFYSVPHRGSSLADLNIPPITARSIELLEISKDCSSVLALQERWLKATKDSKPAVRSLVETCRTLMAVLWLRIVSEESADAGIGALCGVSVDHREICKPSSRTCLLYTELLELIHAALNKCKCDKTRK